VLIKLYSFGYSKLLKYSSFVIYFLLLKGQQHDSEITMVPFSQAMFPSAGFLKESALSTKRLRAWPSRFRFEFRSDPAGVWLPAQYRIPACSSMDTALSASERIMLVFFDL
jgi:hypothetical protein